MAAKPVVDFYLDTACPWSWRKSVWMREVMKVRDLDVHWKFFSLEEVNKANNPDAPTRPGHLESRNTFRTMVLARELLRDPYWPLHAAKALGAEIDYWPAQYIRAKR